MTGHGETHPPDGRPLPGGGAGLDRLPTEYLNTVLESARWRCEMLGTEFSTGEIARQLSIRAVILHRQRGLMERAAFLKLCTALLDDKEIVAEGGIDPDMVNGAAGSSPISDWLEIADRDGIADLQKFLCNSNRRRLAERGRVLLGELIPALGRAGDLSCEHDRAMRLAGISFCRSAGNVRLPPKINWQPVSWTLLQDLEDRIMQEDGAADELIRPAGINNRVELCQLMARTAWLTGMRPAELFSFTIEDAEEVLSDETAGLPGILAGQGAGMAEPPAHPAPASCPARPARMLRIRTIKTRNARASLRQQFRVQILDGIDDEDLSCIERLSCLGGLHLSRQHVRNLIRHCDRLMRRASLEVDPGRPDPVQLHFMRHAFIDHARLVMHPARIAALTGHTARDSVNGYGRRYRRYRPSAKAGRWFPSPDPQRVAEIAREWSRPDPEPSMEPAIGHQTQLPDPSPTDVG